MSKRAKKQKLYCYFDESGQDTKGKLFLVALVVTGNERDELVREAERIEEKSRKFLFKWHKTKLDRKITYLRSILSSPMFEGKLFFARYPKPQGAYLDLMALSAARAIFQKGIPEEAFTTTVVVDGLNQSEVWHFGHILRSLRIHVRKVRGMKDESSSLIRLADALAGFIRDFIESQPYTIELDREFKILERIVEIK
ncbi:MAG TPA: DUF3800 domain-containing protein [Bryobacteraceae bacterium]|nr:DUF3800 domain-containing protein [Bryobacteraceae bacterium]